MANVKILNGYDIKDAKALRDKNVNNTSFIDTRAGNESYPTTNVNLNQCLFIGKGAYNTNPTGANWNVIIGNEAKSGNGSYQTGIGGKSICGDQNYTVAVGYNASAANICSTAIGSGAKANGNYNIAIGYNASTASSGYSITVGSSANSSGNNTVTIGYGCSNNSNGGVAVGQGAVVSSNSISSVAVGQGARVGLYASYSTVIGAGAKNNNYNSYSVSIGYNAEVKQQYSAQIGTGVNEKYGSLQFRSWQLVDGSGKIPEERLPASAVFATATPPQLYPLDEENVPEVAILYTGETCSAMTNSLCYRGKVASSKPRFEVSWIGNDYLKTTNDVIVDQEKLFLKLAEISKERIDDGDTWNSVVGGDNASQSMYFYYNTSDQEWYIEFGCSSFESLDNSTPDNIENITTAQLASDFGIHINMNNFTPEADAENEIFDIEYYAPIYCNSIDSNASEYITINYMMFMETMTDGDWGFFRVVPGMDWWDYTVDGTTYAMPIIPETYSYDGDEYTDITMRWEWNHDIEEWYLYINGEDTGYTWPTTSMYNQFGITIESGEEENIEYIELCFSPAQQYSWEQFDPVDTINNIATKTDISTLTTAVNSKLGYTVEKVNGNISTDWANTKLTTGIYIVKTRNTVDSLFQATCGTLIVFDGEKNTSNTHSITQVFIGGTVTHAVNVPLPANTIWIRSVNYNNVTQQWQFNTWRPTLNWGNASFFDSYDGTSSTQVLKHNTAGTLYWGTGGGGTTYTEGSGIDITGNVISVEDLDCGTM